MKLELAQGPGTLDTLGLYPDPGTQGREVDILGVVVDTVPWVVRNTVASCGCTTNHKTMNSLKGENLNSYRANICE